MYTEWRLAPMYRRDWCSPPPCKHIGTSESSVTKLHGPTKNLTSCSIWRRSALRPVQPCSPIQTHPKRSRHLTDFPILQPERRVGTERRAILTDVSSSAQNETRR